MLTPQPTWRSAASSYADLLVEPMLPEIGYACDVGANNGEFANNTLLFENKGWTVLCIEPNPLLALTGMRNRKLWGAFACGSSSGIMDFNIHGEYPYAAGSGFHYESDKKVRVAVQTLNTALEAARFPQLDLLSIDTEGHELEVIMGCDLCRWKPKIIISEWLEETASPVRVHLESRGYRFIARKYYDDIYERI